MLKTQHLADYLKKEEFKPQATEKMLTVNNTPLHSAAVRKEESRSVELLIKEEEAVLSSKNIQNQTLASNNF